MSSNYDDFPSAGLVDQPDASSALLMMKEYEDNLSESSMPRDRLALSLRDQEYLKHSSLFSGGSAGRHDDTQGASSCQIISARSLTDFSFLSVDDEADQPTAKPASSSASNENVLPAYCNPPNPCPIGYTGPSLRLFLISRRLD